MVTRQDQTMQTFTWELPELGTTEPHNIGDPQCPACCCTGPTPCDECGGILHINTDDELPDGEMGHSRRCDRPCSCIYCPEVQPWLEPHLWNRAVVLEGEIVEPSPALAAAPTAICETTGHDAHEITTYGEPHREFLCGRCAHRWTEPYPGGTP